VHRADVPAAAPIDFSRELLVSCVEGSKVMRVSWKAVEDFSSRVASILMEHFGKNLISLCLFGSAARRNLKASSDMDFLVVLDQAAQSYHKRAKSFVPVLEKIRETEAFMKMEKLKGTLEPNFLIYDREEIKRHPYILLDITLEGIMLHDKDGFLEKELEKIRRRLKELGSLRKTTARGKYWVLKPDLKVGETFEI
jgi:predicted nucleotidyltransferase